MKIMQIQLFGENLIVNINGFIAIFLLVNLLNAQSLQLTYFYPGHHVRVDTSQHQLLLTFSSPVDTVNLKSKIRLLSSYSALLDYNYATNNANQEITINIKKKLKEGEQINVIITNQLQGNTGEAFAGYQWTFIVNPSKRTFPYFTQPVIYPQFWGYGLMAADFNGDNYIDLILSSGQFLLNDGQGNFTLHQDIISGGGIAGNLTDLDYDGYPDLMTLAGVYELGDDGYFHLGSTLNDVDYDYNNDGNFDRILAGNIPPGDTTNYIGLIYSDGMGGFLPEIDTLAIDKNIIGWLSSKDYNNDGTRDIAYVTNIFATPYGVGGENKLVVLYRNDSGEIFHTFTIHNDQFPEAGFFFQMLSSDFNNDNYLDIFLVTNVEDLIVFNNMNNGFLTGANDYQIPGGGDLDHSATISDLNGDSWQDIIYTSVIGANEDANIGYMRNDSGEFNFGQYIYNESWTAIYLSNSADFNNDGALDIASTWYNGLYIFFNTEINLIENLSYQRPEKFKIYSNYPNPFNNSTKIQFELNTPANVESKIFDLNGKEVKRFNRKNYLPGNYYLTWDGKNNAGKEVSSGTYFWHFETDDFSKTVKILLMK